MTEARKPPLPFAQPDIGEDEVAAVTDVLRSGWLTTGGRTRDFETEFAASVQSPAALALNSGTAALHLALIAVGVRPNDIVLTTPMTFCSTVHVIEHLGAKPVLVDVDEESLNLDPDALAQTIGGLSTKPSALMPVHLAGQPVTLGPIRNIAMQHGIATVEDAAHAQGAAYQGTPIGHIDEDEERLAAFSFYATKNITTGEGGMLTGPEHLVEQARLWSLHGMSRDAWKRYGAGGSWKYDVTVPGFKYNMMDLQAAIGLVQLKKSDELLARRRAIANRYDGAFQNVPPLRVPFRSQEDTHAWHLYMLRVDSTDGFTRDELIEGLTSRGIGTSVHFIPIHRLSYYRERYGFSPGQFPVADRAFESLVSLPIYPKMTDGDVEDVIAAVLDTIETAGRG